MYEMLLQYDYKIFHHINQKWAHPWLDHIMNFLSAPSSLLIASAIIVIISVWKKYWTLFYYLLFTSTAVIITDYAAYNLIKPSIKRLRPCKQYNEVRLQNNQCGGFESFPSNHAANSAVISSTFFMFFPQKKLTLLAILIITFIIGISRIYLGVHFPLDVIGGWIFGCIAAVSLFALFLFLRRYLSNFLHKGPSNYEQNS